MPRRARRDIFADAKVILYSPSHSRSEYHSAESRISLRSNTSRRKANITEKKHLQLQVLLFSYICLTATGIAAQ